MKTLEEVNEKIGYRIVKVVIVFLAVVTFIIYNGMSYISYDYKIINEEKSKIVCNFGDKGSFSLKQMDLGSYPYADKEGFSYNEFYQSGNDGNINKILSSCYGYMGEFKNGDKVGVRISEETLRGNITKQLDAQVDKYKVQEYANLYTKDSTSEYILLTVYNLASDSSHELFHIDKVFDNNYKLVKNLLIGNLAILLIYEILKRTLYYIASGTAFPKR